MKEKMDVTQKDVDITKVRESGTEEELTQYPAAVFNVSMLRIHGTAL